MAQPWETTVSQVGALLHARTKDKNGNEVGTFNADTRPTDDQVQDLIAQAADDVADAVGQQTGVTGMPQDLYQNAGSLTAIGAAMLVELSFFPEQVGTNTSPYDRLAAMYKDRLARLVLQAGHEGADVPGDEYMHPAGAGGGNPIPLNWWTPF